MKTVSHVLRSDIMLITKIAITNDLQQKNSLKKHSTIKPTDKKKQ